MTRARAQRDEQIWGSDAAISLPKPLENTDMNVIEMNGFVFTPTGLRAAMTTSDREELLRSGFGPRSPEGPTYG